MAAESSAGCELSVSGIRVLIVCAPRKGKMNTPGIRRGGCDGIVSLEIPAQLFGSLQSVQPCFSQVSTEKSIGRPRKRQIKNPLSSTGSELVFPPAPAQNTVSPNFSRATHRPVRSLIHQYSLSFQNHVIHLVKHSVACMATLSLHISVPPGGDSECGVVRGGG